MQNNLIHKKGRIEANAFKLVNLSAFLLVFIFLISFSSAELFALDSNDLQLGLDGGSTEIGVNFKTPFNFSTVNTVNSTFWWFTGDRGPLRNIGDIQSSWLTNDLFVERTGDTMSGTLDMNGNSVINLLELVSLDGSRIATGTNPAYSMFSGLDSAEVFSNNQSIGDGVITHALLVTESGEEKVIAAWTAGKNDSGHYERNSGGNFPDLGLTNVSILTNMEEMWIRFGIIPFADYFSAENKTSRAALWAFESQKLFLHDDIGNGQLFGEGDFTWVAREGTDIDLYNGDGVHIQKEEIKEFGFSVGDNITSFNANFDAGLLSPFVRTTAGGILTDWHISADAECHQLDCAKALGGSGSPLRSMQANFSSIDQDNLNLSFWITKNAGDSFTIDVNNNIGSGDVEIFSSSSAFSDEFQSIILPSSMEDKSIVTVVYNYAANNPSADTVYIDEVLVVGNATTTTLANVTVFDASLFFGDKTCGIELSVEDGHQDLNITCDNINLIGDVTAIDVTEVSINVTENVTAKNFIATQNFYLDGIKINDTFFRIDGGSVMQGSANLGGFDVFNIGNVNATRIDLTDETNVLSVDGTTIIKTESASLAFGDGAGDVAQVASLMIGTSAGLSSSGILNTYIGTQAGASSAGNSNLFLGESAGQSSTGDTNIFIGANVGLSSTLTNTIGIGKTPEKNGQAIIGGASITEIKLDTDTIINGNINASIFNGLWNGSVDFFKLDGTTPMTGSANLGGNWIYNVLGLNSSSGLWNITEGGIYQGDGSQLDGVWKTATDQTGLTGSKTGSFNVTTTGEINATAYHIGSFTIIQEGDYLTFG